MPMISIIVPVYNVEKYLDRCIKSILDQTFSDYELILIDDGSPDNCPEICDRYAKNDNRIVVIHKPNEGVSSARNAGLDIAKGEYLTFVDSDDWIHQEFLERLYNTCKDNHADLVSCDYVRAKVSKSHETYDSKQSNIVYTDAELFWCDYRIGAPWAKLFKRKIWGSLRFPVGKDCEDLFIIYKYVFSCNRIVFFADKLYYYFYNTEGFTLKWSIKQLDNLDALEEQIQFFISNGYYAALLRACASYLYNITRHISQINADNEHDYRKQKIQLKMRGRRALIKYHKYMKQLVEWEQYAFQFFPIEMKTKDYWNAIKRKLKLSK